MSESDLEVVRPLSEEFVKRASWFLCARGKSPRDMRVSVIFTTNDKDSETYIEREVEDASKTFKRLYGWKKNSCAILNRVKEAYRRVMKRDGIKTQS